ncbi:CbiX/SirB N-terminal domain-containing protein [Propionicimonas sp.]|uniref:CbiX/SirB N-terminal domain-containing protein n=1 Tax=Propionicimonas sp. TaxID=1955623 RepID=UPI0039E5AF7D
MTHTEPAPLPAAVPVTPPPLVIAGHGTRVNAGASAAGVLVEKVRALLPDVRVEAGFVELTPPTIDEALDLVLAGAPAAVVVPLMIGTGSHVRDDIPEAIDASRARHLDATVVSTRHLGSPAPMIDAVHQRIAAARGDWPAAETDVVMVGRGCSVTDANADHVRLSRVVFETGGYHQVLSAFIQVARPTLPQILHQYYASGSRRIVVMPHFLFTGRLDEWVHQQVDAFRTTHPDATIRIANVIGPCDELAQVVAQRYKEGALRARTTAGSPAYLTGLLLAGRKVVVVGGGCVARRRVPKLLEAGAQVEVVAPELHTALAGLADAGGFTWHARGHVPSDLDGAWYVMATTDSAEVNAAIVAEAEARHTFCVRADRADDGSAWTPATGDAAGVTVAAVTTHDPLRARRIRNRFVELVNEEGL